MNDDRTVFERRDFLKLVGVGVAGLTAGCAKPPAEKLIPYLIAPEDVLPGVPYFYASTCRECPVGCGLIARTREGRAIKLEGNAAHPINQGGLCARGQAGLQGLYDPDRIKTPLVKDGANWKPATWDEALALVGGKLQAAKGRTVLLTGLETGSLRALAGEFVGGLNGKHVMWEPFGYEAVRAANKATYGVDAVPRLDVAAAMQYAADSVLSGLGRVLLVGALLGLVTITALNFYGASLTLLSVADTVKPLRCTAAKRLASLAVAFVASNAIALGSSSNFVNRFEDLLSLLLYLFTPWTAINLVDFYVVRKGHYSIREIFNPAGMYGHWNWRGLLAYVVGFIVMIPFFSSGMYTGPIARALGGADIAMLVGLPVSAGIYLLACRSIDLHRDRQRAAAADIGLDPDDGATAQIA